MSPRFSGKSLAIAILHRIEAIFLGYIKAERTAYSKASGYQARRTMGYATTIDGKADSIDLLSFCIQWVNFIIEQCSGTSLNHEK